MEMTTISPRRFLTADSALKYSWSNTTRSTVQSEVLQSNTGMISFLPAPIRHNFIMAYLFQAGANSSRRAAIDS